MNKPVSISVPGSVITAKTAAGYLARIAARLLADGSMEACCVLAEIEERIVRAGFLTPSQCEDIEISTYR